MEYLPLFPLLFAFISNSVGYALLALPGTWSLMFQMVIITQVLPKWWLFSGGALMLGSCLMTTVGSHW